MPSSIVEAIGSLPVDGIGGPVDADDARRRADDILSGAEYREPGETILDRVLGWLGDRVGDLVFGGPGSAGRGIVAWAVVAVLIGLVVWVVLRTVALPGSVRVRPGDGLVFGTDTVTAPGLWMDEARRLAAAGDHRGALRCRHQALIATWIADGMIDHVIGRTAGECHAAAIAAGVPADASRPVVERFDEVWYGAAPVTAEGYAAFDRACAAIGTARPAPVRAAR